MVSLAIEVPWPAIALSPNSRDRWGQIKAKRAAKEAAYYLTKELMGQLRIRPGSWVGPVTVQYTFYPKTNRTRDDDNFISRMKSARDGIAQALGINDASFITMPAVFADKTAKPRVVVTMRPSAMIDLRGEIS